MHSCRKLWGIEKYSLRSAILDKGQHVTFSHEFNIWQPKTVQRQPIVSRWSLLPLYRSADPHTFISLPPQIYGCSELYISTSIDPWIPNIWKSLDPSISRSIDPWSSDVYIHRSSDLNTSWILDLMDLHNSILKHWQVLVSLHPQIHRFLDSSIQVSQFGAQQKLHQFKQVHITEFLSLKFQ